MLKRERELQRAGIKGKPPRKPLGQWLVENMPRGANLEIPGDRNESGRDVPGFPSLPSTARPHR